MVKGIAWEGKMKMRRCVMGWDLAVSICKKKKCKKKKSLLFGDKSQILCNTDHIYLFFLRQHTPSPAVMER